MSIVIIFVQKTTRNTIILKFPSYPMVELKRIKIKAVINQKSLPINKTYCYTYLLETLFL